jgi:mannose-6-phosphate isomerase
MHRLTGSRRSYDWGSTTSMFEFLGTEPDGAPFAELWLGAHPTGPSTVPTPQGPQRLDDVIDADPARNLGQDVQNRFGRLPYLLKLLAPAKPLSMQVHPTPAMAKAGFEAEEQAGIPLDDPSRSFKDEHHKPEMVFALTRFEGLVGFRSRTEVLGLLETLGGAVKPAYEALVLAPESEGLQPALEQLLELTASDVDTAVARCRQLAESTTEPGARTAYATVAELAGFYPGDVGPVISLLLNRVVLQPGQLVFLGDGIPHAYLSGFGLELMANSDNVLRLGMTSKHIDVDAMLEALDFSSAGFALEAAPDTAATHVFRPPVPEFALSISRPGKEPGSLVLDQAGPRVLICVEGTVRVRTAGDPEGQELKAGEAVFVPDADGPATADGAGTLAQAFVPGIG